MKSKKISVIGHIGGNLAFFDGQTVKTRILISELENSTTWKIHKVDTYCLRKNPFKLAVDTAKAFFTTNDIIVLLSSNGMRFFFPLLYFLAKYCKKRVYHDVIGGNLAQHIESNPAYLRYLNEFKVNWVETNLMRKELAHLGLNNTEVIPNFKRLPVVEAATMDLPAAPPFCFCTFSRVSKEKGIEEAIRAIENINRQAGAQLCMLDIYGRIDADYSERFREVMGKVTSAIQYKGAVPFDKSVATIQQYYALLFPTFWKGEGFAGTIVDAFSAGVPVIASDWRCNGEIVKNGETGLLYPNDEIGNLEDAVAWAMENPETMRDIKRKCARKALDYQPDQYVKRMINTIESE